MLVLKSNKLQNGYFNEYLHLFVLIEIYVKVHVIYNIFSNALNVKY